MGPWEQAKLFVCAVLVAAGIICLPGWWKLSTLAPFLFIFIP